MRRERPKARWLASFACDCPFLPMDMVERLITKARGEGATVAVAESGAQHHPVFAVWSADITASPEDILVKQGLRKMDDFIATLPNVRVRFEAEPIDPFVNINTPEDLAHAEDYIVEQGAMG
jgi:molybdopterin-guanine dinucleotide biosynthesis protein A